MFETNFAGPYPPSIPGQGEASVGEQVGGRAKLVLQVVALLHNSQPASPCSCQLNIAHHSAGSGQSSILLLLLL